MTTYADMAKAYVSGAKALKPFIPKPWESFSSLHSASIVGGVVPARFKELMSVAIGIAVHCDGCIALHTRAAIDAGATKEEFTEMIAVALLMGGGPASVYGVHALEAFDEFEGNWTDKGSAS